MHFKILLINYMYILYVLDNLKMDNTKQDIEIVE